MTVLMEYPFVLKVMLLVICLVVGVVALTLYLRRVYSRFSRYGVRSLKPVPIFGNMARITTRMEHFAHNTQRLYNAFPDERFVGRYDYLDPIIVIKDINLIKTITTKDFEHFLDHRTSIDEKIDSFFGRNLFSLKGEEWKEMRSTLSPAFTSSKIRLMVPFMVDVGEKMIKSLKMKIKHSKQNSIDIDCKDLTSRCGNDIIASCAFGLMIDSHTEENNIFYKMSKDAITFNFKELLKIITLSSWPNVAKLLRINIFSEATKYFFRDLVKNTISDREAKNIVRPDMIHLLMEAKKGNLKYEEKSSTEADAGFATVEESSVGKNNVIHLWTDNDIVAQVMLFLIGGFDTVSTAMSFSLHELAMNPDVQEQLYREIQECDARNNGKIDFDSIHKLKYLDMVVSEVLRLWPPFVLIDRLCVKDYNLGKSNEGSTKDYIVRKGETIMIPAWSIHRDPKYYSDPEKFDPERFSEKRKHLIKPFTYFPFGLGPRNCIGSRFALCEIKVLLYQLLLHVQLSPSEKTCIPVELAKGTFSVRIKGGHWVGFKLRC